MARALDIAITAFIAVGSIIALTLTLAHPFH